MERAFNIFKLVSLAALVVVALLCLSYSHAYGYSAAVGIGKPSNVVVNSGNTGSGNNTDLANLDHNWDRDNYISTPDNSDNGLPPTTVPEPGTLILLGSGLLGLARYVRRRS